MVPDSFIESQIQSHIATIDATRVALGNSIGPVAQVMSQALLKGGALLWCGNGGSAADSQHLAAEFVGRFRADRRALRSLALTTDTSVLTCVSNDYSYEDVFSRQVEAIAREGDILVGISTSGDSENVIRAFHAAHSRGVTTVALLGKGGGAVQGLAHHVLLVPSDDTARIQEAHILIGHILCGLVEQELGLA